MRVVFFSTQSYDREFFQKENLNQQFEFVFYESQLNPDIVHVIDEADAICVFVNDIVNKEVLEVLANKKVKIVALRCAGFNNVDLKVAAELGITVCRVPAYSPEAVAEHTIALLLTLNRKTHKAYNRVREQNFALAGLLGFNLHQKVVGVIGTGQIGKSVIKILLGFGCRILAYDPYEDADLINSGVQYVPLDELYQKADIVSLHCPLTAENKYLVNKSAIDKMKDGVVILNTSRGGLLETSAVIDGLKSKKIGGLAIDVYEQEEKMFFKNLSETIIEDDILQRLISFPNVLVTAHQAFFTDEALTQITQTTLLNIREILNKEPVSTKNGIVG